MRLRPSSVDAETPKSPTPGRRRLGLAALALILLAPLGYWGIAPIFLQSIDDDPAFAGEPPAGGSHAVATAAALIEREIEGYGWTPNLPFFFPMSSIGADDMPNYQIGIKRALHRFALEMSDQIGRVRGSSEVDPDLDLAVGHLSYQPDVWYVGAGGAGFDVASNERYLRAMETLRRYNERLSTGDATFERRGDNLLAALDRIALDVGSLSASIGDSVSERNWLPFDFEADDRFYEAKGRIYAYYVILKALERDFADLIADRGLEATWTKMLESMREAAELAPPIILNGDPDGLSTVNHLVAQGFYLLRARTQLREITNILLK